MAAREHSCTRRALLGGAIAGAQALTLPSALGGRVPPSPLEGEGEWQAALAAVRRAEAELVGFKAAEPEEVSFEVQCALDEAFSDRVVEFNEAVQALLIVPAPDLPALAVKLAIAVEQQAWELPEGEECMAALNADAARLCGGR